MASRTIRAGAPVLRLQSHQPLQLTQQAHHQLRTLASTSTSAGRSTALPAPRVPRNTFQTGARTTAQTFPITQPPSVRGYSTQSPTADAIIDEIQDLYEVAKDEFEIATDSTDSATIYAASDRESARDALNELCAVYYLYTVDAAANSSQSTGVVLPGRGEDGMPGEIPGNEIVAGQSLGERGPVIEPGFVPGDVGNGVREEVRRRIGQRIRELRNAVEMLEERAKAD
ncbi:hypothetical protein N7492_010253 [Penicillium capsulatum]|uniref:Uncharacterized protein n=1 Tax=Penicillium capsulatum TaxID=69766 RepID=A0A9W9LEY6_9EURO|nr:hypothetical protein N7492_010253 [Penicillium capsulatum]KAJ6112760.1 hypothetical protein N7512_008084 [Penicillium capsulatum]